MKIKVFIKIILISAILIFAIQTNVFAESNSFEEASEIYDKISLNTVLNTVISELKKAFLPSLRMFSSLFGLLIISSVINTFGVNFDRFDLGEYVSIICFSSILFSIIKSLCESVENFADMLFEISSVLMPVLVSSSFSDGALSAKTSAIGTSVTVSVIEFSVSSVVIPSVKILFVLAITSSIVSNTIDLRAFSSSLRTFSVFVVGLLMTANVTVIHFQSVLARATDGVATRGIRFAAANFLPIVGNMLGESMKTISESMRAVGKVTGVVGVTAILSAALPTIAACIIFKIELNLLACVAKTIGCSKQGAMLSDVGGVLNVLNGGLVVTSVGFCIVICLISKVL